MPAKRHARKAIGILVVIMGEVRGHLVEGQGDRAAGCSSPEG